MPKQKGPQMKYSPILATLKDDVVYTPATITYYAAEHGSIPNHGPEKHGLMCERVRVAMARFSKSKKFPPHGDALVTLRGQSPTPGWYGWRWKAAIDN